MCVCVCVCVCVGVCVCVCVYLLSQRKMMKLLRIENVQLIILFVLKHLIKILKNHLFLITEDSGFIKSNQIKYTLKTNLNFSNYWYILDIIYKCYYG